MNSPQPLLSCSPLPSPDRVQGLPGVSSSSLPEPGEDGGRAVQRGTEEEEDCLSWVWSLEVVSDKDIWVANSLAKAGDRRV